jgi:PIN domain nuclease of toxin-antitoxin system
VKVLLDTHVFLWAITEDAKLSRRAREIFVSRSSELFFSVASVWEVHIKVQIKRLPLPMPAMRYLREHLATNGVQVFPIMLDHVARLEDLPIHHRDPFDRIVIAQSIEEGLPIVSADPFLKNYPVQLIW